MEVWDEAKELEGLRVRCKERLTDEPELENRKPYCAVTGCGARRKRTSEGPRVECGGSRKSGCAGWRIMTPRWRRIRLECGGNEVWGWDRDGKQRLLVPSGDEGVEAIWFRKLQRK